MMMTAGMVMGQLKVVSSGNAIVGESSGVSGAALMTINDATNASLRISENSNDYFTQLQDRSNTQMVFEKFSPSTALIDINPKPMDGSSNAAFRFFRETSTTGGVFFDVHRGDGTAAVNHRLSGNSKSYLNLTAGNLGVGLSNPTSKLDVAGDISINGVVKVTSDKRLKKNIKSFNAGLETVLKIRPVEYEYNGKAATANVEGPLIGVIAQELQKAAPYLVEKFTYAEEDLDGNIVLEEDYLRIKDSEIKYLLINAIKDQNEVIREMQDELLILKRELSDIRMMDNVSESVNSNSVNNGYRLEQNSPNPSNGFTAISYDLNNKVVETAQIDFVDLKGKVVKSIKINDSKGVIRVNTDDFAVGTYSYILSVDGERVESKRMAVFR